MERAEVASQFISLTNCTDTEASFYLEAANYDLDRAVAMFFGEPQAKSIECSMIHAWCNKPS